MSVLNLFDLFPPPPLAEMPATPPAMADFKVLEVFHSFNVDLTGEWHLAASFGCEPDAAPLGEREREILMETACILAERYGAQVESGAAGYAHAAARFPDRVVFVYLARLWWPALAKQEMH